MRETVVAIALLAAGTASPPAGAQALEQPPGYGVVESVVPIRAEESASAGSSARGKAERARADRYLVRVRMDDGTIQVRSVKKAEVKPGERALITNAGDVLPE